MLRRRADDPGRSARSPMIIVLIHWKVKLGQEAAFRGHWQSVARLGGAEGLIGEFLSEETAASFPFVSFPAAAPDCANFYNVALWHDRESFERGVGSHFNEEAPPLAFEALRRARYLFEPVEWRRGVAQLPPKSSPGTL